jgi:hypothetical protein
MISLDERSEQLSMHTLQPGAPSSALSHGARPIAPDGRVLPEEVCGRIFIDCLHRNSEYMYKCISSDMFR